MGSQEIGLNEWELKRHGVLERMKAGAMSPDRAPWRGGGANAHDVGAPLDLAVQSLERVGTVNLGAVLPGRFTTPQPKNDKEVPHKQPTMPSYPQKATIYPAQVTLWH